MLDLIDLMKTQDERELRESLALMRARHRELDLEIVAQEESPRCDQLLITRLKKKKLKIKDEIIALEDRLLPDIIA